MRHRVAAAQLLALVSARSWACPSCAANTTSASGGTGIWWIVGAFLLIPPLIALVVAAVVRREMSPSPEVPKW